MYRLKVQHILYLIAVVFGVIGFLNFQSSMRTSSYEKVSGYITDVEETSELTKAGYKPRYNYIIHWFRDGEEYQRAVYEALSEPDESATEFWASLDNTDAIASEPAGIRTEAYLNWLVAALSAILGGMIDGRNTRKTGKTEADVEMKGKMRRFYGQLLHFAWLLVLLLQDFHYGFRIETVIT